MNRGSGDVPRGSYRQRGMSDDAGAYDNRPPSWRHGDPEGGDHDWNRRRPAPERGGRGHFADRERDGPHEPRDRFPRNNQGEDAPLPLSARRDRAGSYDKAGGSNATAEGGWARGARPTAGGDGPVAKDKLKVNQVNTTLLRPNREIVVATNLTPGPAMKVLTKQSVGASASAGEATATTSTENTPVPPAVADAASSADRDNTDAFSKSFASLLSQFKDKNSGNAGGAGANTSRPRESDRSQRDGEPLEDERGYEDDERGHFRDRRRRVDDAEGDNDYSHRNYPSRRFRDDYGEDDGYGGRYGGRPPRGGRDFDHRERDGDYGHHGHNDARGRFHQDHHGGYGRPSGPPGPPPPRRKGGMLYEPKSGQFVEDREKEMQGRDEPPAGGRGRKHSEGSASHSGADVGDGAVAEWSAPAESTVPETSAAPASAPAPAEPRWSRVSVIKRALAEESGLKDAAPASAAESKEKKTPSLSKEQLEEQRRQRAQEEQRIKRTQERLQRGPRTKGQLFRFTADGGIEEAAATERVWDEAIRESLEAVVGARSSRKKVAKDAEAEKPVETPVAPEAVASQTIDASEVVAGAAGVPPALTASLPLETVAESIGAESVGGDALGVPSTPRLSELAATASVFTPSQPLLASLQAQQQSLPSLAYPGLIMTGAGADTPTATSNPLASTTPMQTAPPPPMFLSSPGMTNMLFGQQATSAASMPDMFAHPGTFTPMNALGMNTLGTINAFNAMNFQAQLPHHLASHQHAYGMMPGMIVDTGNSAASSMQSIYGYDPRFSGNGNVVGGLGWNSVAATAPAAGAAGIGMLSDSAGNAGAASGGNADSGNAAARQGGAKDMFSGAGAAGAAWGYGTANAGGVQRGSSGGIGQAGNSTLYGGGEDFYYGVASSGGGNSGVAGFFPAGGAGSDGGVFKVNGVNMGFFSGGGNANMAMMGDMFFAPSGGLAQQQMLQQQQQQQQMQMLQQQQQQMLQHQHQQQQQQQAQFQQQSGQPVVQSTGPEATGALIADASGRSPAIGGVAADGSNAGAAASPSSQQLAPPAQGGVVPMTLPMATTNAGAVNSAGAMFDMSGNASAPFMGDQSMGGDGYLYGNQRFTQQGYNQFGGGGYGGYNASYNGNFNSNNANGGGGGRGYRNNHGGGYGGNSGNNYYSGGDAYANSGSNYNNNYGGAGAQQYHAAPGGFTQRRNNNNNNNGSNNNNNGGNGNANGNNPMYYNAYSN